MPGTASSQRVERAEWPRIVDLWFDAERVSFAFADRSVYSAPLEWFPRLAGATPAQRENFELLSEGVHWPDVDEDLSARGVLQGEPDPELRRHQAGWKSPLLT